MLLIVKWLGFCLHHFWEMTHKPRWECLQSFFCSKGEIKLQDCVTLKHFPKLPDFHKDVLEWRPLTKVCI